MLKKDINKGILKIIQVSDYEHSDYTALCKFDQQEFLRRNYKRDLHIKQFISSRLILKSLIENHYSCTYYGLPSINGKPLPLNQLNVSLSHSENLVAVAISEQPIGIDLQAVLPKIVRVIPRICCEKELELATDNIKRTIIWSAKEAMYKYAEKEGLNFKTDLFVDSISIFTGIFPHKIRRFQFSITLSNVLAA